MRANGRTVLAGAIVLCFGTTLSSAQDLTNPSFEEPELVKDNPWGDLAAGWGRWGNWMNRETQWQPTHSGECLMGYHHWQIEQKDPSGFYQDIPNIPDGTPCVFSIHAYRDEGTNVDSVELRIEKLGGYGTFGSRVFTSSDIRKNGWGRLSVSATTEGDEGIRVLVVVTPCQDGIRNGAVKFDDAELSVRFGE